MDSFKSRTEDIQKKLHQEKYNTEFEDLLMDQVGSQQQKVGGKINKALDDFRVQGRYHIREHIKKIVKQREQFVKDIEQDFSAISLKVKDAKNQASDQIEVQIKAIEDKISNVENNKSDKDQYELVIDEEVLKSALQKALKIKIRKPNGTGYAVKSVFPNMNEDEEEEIKIQEIPLNNQYLLQYIQATTKLEVYNIQSHSVKQKNVNNYIFPQLAGSCMLGNYAFIIGGLASGSFCNTTIRANVDAKITKLANMAVPRSSFPITFNKDSSGMSNKLLIVSTGGHNTAGVLRDCEVYDVRSNKWTGIARMNQGRQLHASCLIEDNNLCYVFSGQISPYNFINSVERVSINCQSDSSSTADHSVSWQKIEMQESILGDFRLCAIYCKEEGKMLLFGGGEGNKKAYKLDGSTGQIVEKFEECTLIPSPYYCSVFGFNEGMIYCVGYENDSFQALPQLFKWQGSDWSKENQSTN